MKSTNIEKSKLLEGRKYGYGRIVKKNIDKSGDMFLGNLVSKDIEYGSR